jgi:hypothetical protein
MADHAPLTHRFVLIDKWAALLCVTFEAGFVLGQESKAASSELLLNVCRSAFNRDSFVRFMAITAAHLAFKYRMMMRQLKRCANVQVTLETSVRRLSRIDDGALSAASLNMQTPGTVARFAAHVLGVIAFCLETSVSGRPKVAHNFFVACCAFLRTNKLRASDAGRCENCSVRRTAGKQNYRQRHCSPCAPQKGFAPTVDPSS